MGVAGVAVTVAAAVAAAGGGVGSTATTDEPDTAGKLVTAEAPKRRGAPSLACVVIAATLTTVGVAVLAADNGGVRRGVWGGGADARSSSGLGSGASGAFHGRFSFAVLARLRRSYAHAVIEHDRRRLSSQ